jgi:hypothetical protein
MPFDDKYFIVEASWLHVFYEIGAEVGDLTNESLYEAGKLKFGLIKTKDYGVVNEEQWNFLRELVSLCRPIIKPRAELYMADWEPEEGTGNLTPRLSHSENAILSSD